MDDTALETIDARLVALGRRIRELLAIDLEAWFVETVRERFVNAPGDGSEATDEQVRHLKSRARAAAREAAAALAERLDDAVWTSPPRPDPLDAPITALPAVADAIADAERRLGALLADLEADGVAGGPPAPWRLPVRFIDGESLPVLTRNYWKTLARRDGELQSAERRQAASVVEARRRRWEEA